ncbi:hypothetical protein [Aliiroseovarius sp. F20344]|uniref:hypothetical protein n=1 Tax=Aliiroseovarius sp. F20344 TaxID=2926414 RepID=UPI001FF2BF3F|nr:hypothetical protein [Aliiroseovarius sp. F20344]MCK0143969.1 hypothetical protein [Aliiroseovarius sp. F20344]
MSEIAQFKYGDVVEVVGNTTKKPTFPQNQGSICGIHHITSVKQAQEFSVPYGSAIYLVEFSDGTAIEVPESLLRLSR